MKELFPITTEARKPVRFFLAKVDSKPTLFAFWSDNSITVAPGPALGLIESLADVRDERWYGLFTPDSAQLTS